jgi:hypothetical protein
MTAVKLYEALTASSLLLGEGDSSAIPVDEFYISVPNTTLADVQVTDTGSFTYAYKYGRDAGRLDVEYVRRVPMSRENLSPVVRNIIRSIMPGVWSHLVLFNAESPRCSGLPDSARITSNE